MTTHLNQEQIRHYARYHLARLGMDYTDLYQFASVQRMITPLFPILTPLFQRDVSKPLYDKGLEVGTIDMKGVMHEEIEHGIEAAPSSKFYLERRITSPTPREVQRYGLSDNRRTDAHKNNGTRYTGIERVALTTSQVARRKVQCRVMLSRAYSTIIDTDPYLQRVQLPEYLKGDTPEGGQGREYTTGGGSLDRVLTEELGTPSPFLMTMGDIEGTNPDADELFEMQASGGRR